jgi:hypothetical protein
MTSDLETIAQGAIIDLRTATDRLSEIVLLPGADVADITAMIDMLQKKQDDLMQAIQSAEIFIANETVISAANVAASKLKEEVATIPTVENAVHSTRRVIEHATELEFAIAPPTPWPTPGRGKK